MSSDSWRPQRFLRLYGSGLVRMERSELEPPRQGQVTVAMRLAGICGSDLHRIFDERPHSQPMPAGYPGHEIVGRVAECPSGRFHVGERVLVVPEGEAALGFADVQNFPEHSLLCLPDEVEWVDGLMCQQIGTVIYALKRFWPGPSGDTAAVIGGGSAGQIFVMLLRKAGFRHVLLAERSETRLAAGAQVGADVLVKVPDSSPREACLRLTSGKGADLVIDATGTPEGRRSAMSCIGFRGEVGLFGLPGADEEESFPFRSLFEKQVRIDLIAGAQSEPDLKSFKEAMALVRGGLDVSGMVSHRFALEEADEAFAHARRPAPGARKVIFHIN